MTAPNPGVRADSDRLAAANRWLDRHGDTITHRGRACSVLNDQELAELVHATVAAACNQARAEGRAVERRSSRRELERWLRMAGDQEDAMPTEDDILVMQGRYEAVEIIRECIAADDEADTAAVLAAHDRHVRVQALHDAAGALIAHPEYNGDLDDHAYEFLRARADAEEADGAS